MKCILRVLGILSLIVGLLMSGRLEYTTNYYDYTMDILLDIEVPMVDIDEHKLDNVLYTLSGDLTGYAADCPMCNGTLACKRDYNVYKNNVLSYNDDTYGSVRIVASSKALKCGSIISFDSKVLGETTYAIVLDRGVLGNNIDLLVESEMYAAKYIGRSNITYNVLREGW